jgi:hypothetical protein
VFGDAAALLVCVNTIPPKEARRRTGEVPEGVAWVSAPARLPQVLAPYLDGAMSEGAAWKLSPLQAFDDRLELALDNDVILWGKPQAIGRWLDGDPLDRVIAADVAPAHGQFADLCGPEPRNSGIRGTPPGLDLAAALARVLAERPVALNSELDEQGLQIAALSLDRAPLVVTTEEVSICSPFPPHQPQLGRCGAHFVGLNARDLPWRYYGRPAREVRLEHWRARRGEVYARVGLAPA